MTDRGTTNGPDEGRLASDPVPGPRVDTRGSVVAVVAEDDDRYRAVRERAAEIARAEGRMVILYDVGATSPFADPLPSVWSGDGPAERPDGPLDEHALKTAGRSEIADQVGRLRESGVDAAAWLPSDPGGDALRAYAIEQGAAVVVVPADFGGLDALKAPAELGEDAATSPRTALRVIQVEA
jgi:nucleotide-binding universal stress UspA family protein